MLIKDFSLWNGTPPVKAIVLEIQQNATIHHNNHSPRLDFTVLIL
jgi:hypothetical protein